MQNDEPVLNTSERQENIDKTYFFLKNLFKGLIWLGIIIGGYFYIVANYDITMESLLGSIYHKPLTIYLIFLGSETIFGIFPPELFMIWALREGILEFYILNVIGLAVISYLAGVIGYYVGSHFSTTRLYITLKKNYIGRYEKYFNKYGGFLVIVAAFTPIPFSAICMLMGAVKYPFKRFLFISASRFIRFAIYAAIVWEANILQ